MAGAGSVRVEGLAELHRNLAALGSDVKRELQRELRGVAAPVATDVRGRLAGLNGRTISGVRPASRPGAALVRQSARSTTGTRPDFGALQMRRGFLPALRAAGPDTVRRVEALLDRVARKHN